MPLCTVHLDATDTAMYGEQRNVLSLIMLGNSPHGFSSILYLDAKM